MPEHGNDQSHLEQVRQYILKKGFDEPLLISINPNDRRVYVCEGNHRLWVAVKESISHVPCRVTPQWLEPHGLYQILHANTATLKEKQEILPEDLGLRVKQQTICKQHFMCND